MAHLSLYSSKVHACIVCTRVPNNVWTIYHRYVHVLYMHCKCIFSINGIFLETGYIKFAFLWGQLAIQPDLRLSGIGTTLLNGPQSRLHH